MILDTPLDEAWAALSTLPPARGSLAGHTGTAELEELDDDTHTATFRLQGVGPSGPRTATVIATLEPAGEGTRLHLATRSHPDPPRAPEIEAIASLIARAVVPTPAEPARSRWVPASFRGHVK